MQFFSERGKLKRAFHLGDWEIEPKINCVRRGDRSYHLEPKVMQVLVTLAMHPDEVLSKDELISTVWADTFVSDDVLTRSISEIRRALEDDARAPRFIQTIPKVGYRVIAPVIFESEAKTAGATDGLQNKVAPPDVTAPLPEIERSGRNRRSFVVAAGLAVIAAILVFGWGYRNRDSHADLKIVPFTSSLGLETQPAFSPEGNQIAYSWKDEASRFQHIYVKLIGSETPLQLTSADANDFSPVYSPNGKSIAFLRKSKDEAGIFVVPVIGGPATKVYSQQGTIEWDRSTVSWSPDGRTLIVADGKTAHSPSAIYQVELSSREAKPITFPPKFWDGDSSPVFSPDGTRIAFVRTTEGYVRDIYVMAAGGGEPQPVTQDERLVSGLAWTADSSSIVFSSNRAGKYSLWRISAKGGKPERLSVGGEDAFAPAISPVGNSLAYVQRSAKWSLMRVDLEDSQAKRPARLLASTQQDSAPQFSPDGTRIAFQSWRSGNQEIWLSATDGTQLVMLTNFGGPLTGSPSWSPDGQQIAFDSRVDRHSHIFSIPANGGTPHSLTKGEFNDVIPSWSRDGRSLYFGSNRSGSWQIWKLPAAGGEPVQVTKKGGFVAIESADRKWLYYARVDAAGLWKVPVDGGAETQVLDQPAVGFWGYWNIAGEDIYFLGQRGDVWTVEALNTATMKQVRIAELERTPPQFAGIAVSPDRKTLLLTDLTEVGSHITLVENFR